MPLLGSPTAVSNIPRNLHFCILGLSSSTNPVLTSSISLLSALTLKGLPGPRNRLSPFNIVCLPRTVNRETQAITSAPNPHFCLSCSSYTEKTFKISSLEILGIQWQGSQDLQRCCFSRQGHVLQKPHIFYLFTLYTEQPPTLFLFSQLTVLYYFFK